MARILIVDDEEHIRSIIRKYAEFEGHTVEEAENGLQAVSMVSFSTYDLIILDIMMPEMDGFTALKQMRKVMDTPVIMLSAMGEEYDRIRGFESGVDDYVVKPFSPRELMLRISAVLKRRGDSSKDSRSEGLGASDAAHDIYRFKELTVDYTSRTVTVDGEQKKLTYKEYELLVYFIRNKNIALSREQILTAVWGYDFCGDDRTLDTHVKFLRNDLGSCRNLVQTIRNVGYRFEEN